MYRLLQLVSLIIIKSPTMYVNPSNNAVDFHDSSTNIVFIFIYYYIFDCL